MFLMLLKRTRVELPLMTLLSLLFNVNSIPLLETNNSNSIEIGLDGEIVQQNKQNNHTAITGTSSYDPLNDLLDTAGMQYYQSCSKNIDCKVFNSFCSIRNRCECRTHHFNISNSCLKLVDENGICVYRKQCRIGSCAFSKCECFKGRCRYEIGNWPNDEKRLSGMSKIILAIVGAIVLIGIISIYTTVYRMCQFGRAVTPSRIMTISNSLGSPTEQDQHNDKPPKYEDILAEEPEPPSYVEFLEFQEKSLHPQSLPLVPGVIPQNNGCTEARVNYAFERY